LEYLQIDTTDSVHRIGETVSECHHPESSICRVGDQNNDLLANLGVNSDTTVRFADTDFLMECEISAIWRRFPLIVAFYKLKVRHISSFGLFDLLT